MTDMTVGNVIGVKITGQTAKTQKTTDFVAEFAGIMNQNQQSFLDAATDYAANAGENGQEIFNLGAVDASQTSYEKLGNGNRQITQTRDTAKADTVEPEQVEDLAQAVEDTVKETMQVDDAQLEEAMEELGLTAVDLLQPQNLIQLMQTLTGSEDAAALLMDGNVQATLQDVSTLLTAFQQENGLDAAGFTDLVAQLSQNIDELTEEIEPVLEAVEQSPEMETEIFPEPAETDEASQAVDITENTANDGLNPAQDLAAKTENVRQTPQTAQEEPQQAAAAVTEENIPVAERTANADSGQNGQADPDGGTADGQKLAQTEEKTENEDFTGVLDTMPQNAAEPVAAIDIPQVQTQPLEGYVELQNLMDQLEGLARTFASAEGTTVEMQLNPENLGRLTLTVSEKQGAVTAQITASNEQVKEALQTQMVELRATLQSQGVKVQAVEVTVATHEFEQNLDGNTSANGQEEEDGRQQAAQMNQRRRNLDLNSLDELSGLMSEEETLAAQIMRDNGGSVDYTA